MTFLTKRRYFDIIYELANRRGLVEPFSSARFTAAEIYKGTEIYKEIYKEYEIPYIKE